MEMPRIKEMARICGEMDELLQIMYMLTDPVVMISVGVYITNNIISHKVQSLNEFLRITMKSQKSSIKPTSKTTCIQTDRAYFHDILRLG